MAKDDKVVNPFNFSGELSKISYEQKKIKYIKLVTESGEYWIKIPKQLRKKIGKLFPGCKLQVEGETKHNAKKETTKYKAQTIMVLASEQLDMTTSVKTKTVSLLPVFNSQVKSKAKVLICQKSNCWKKGGKKVCAEIEAKLQDLGLTQKIPIKKTGCLKQCKKAPALVMMPDKVIYKQVKPKQAARLVEKHLIAE
ncbi:MAG: (2Fe-2S) ferredoxin domain-containing protein [Cyanobacteria bacterium J06600_6]